MTSLCLHDPNPYDAALAEAFIECYPGGQSNLFVDKNSDDDDVKVSGMMHLLVSGDFISKDVLYQTIEDVYRNFTSIHKVAVTRLKARQPKSTNPFELIAVVGNLITFCKCFTLKLISEEDGITVNVSLACLLSDIELYLLQLIHDSIDQNVDDISMFHHGEQIERVCKACREHSPIYFCYQLIVRPDIMMEFIHQCLHHLDLEGFYDFPNNKKKEKLKKEFNFLKLLTNEQSQSHCKDLLIAVENVAHQMALYIFHCQMCHISVDGCDYIWKNYPRSKFRTRILKALVLQSTPIMSDELVVEYFKYVQENLLDLLQNRAITPKKDTFKSQLWILHERISFLLHWLITPMHNFQQHILSNIKLDFQVLTRNVGCVVCSCLENPNDIEEISLFDLLEKVNVIKGEIIKTVCCMVLREAEREPSTEDQLTYLIILLKNLKEFMDRKPASIITWKDHENLVFFIYYLFQNNIRGNNCTSVDEFSKYTIQLDVAVINHEELNMVLISAQVDAFNMSCYSLLKRYEKLRWWELYLGTEEHVEMHMYVGILKAIVLSSSTPWTDELTMAYRECVQDSLINLLRDEAFYAVKDQLDIFLEKLPFLGRFLICYLDENEKLSPIKADFQELVKSVGSFIYPSFKNMVNGDIKMQQSTTDLSTLTEKMNLIIGETEEVLHIVNLNKVGLESPKTNQLGALNSILENWRELMECESGLLIIWKAQFKMIYEDLVLFKAFIASRSVGHDESENLCSSIMNATHVAEYLLNTFHIGTCPVQCTYIWISEFTKHVELLAAAVMEVNMKTLNMEDIIIARKERSHVYVQGLLVPTSRIVVVGYELEMKLIRKRLFADLKQLDVISIIGMPGLGKTTLARKAYEDPSAIEHFDVRAWCSVSLEYNKKDLLLIIVGRIIELTDKIRKQSEADLSLMVHKQLTGRRYLIVLDDIWDIKVFYDLKLFFPDDNKGSRVMLTSRSEVIGSKATLSDINLIRPALLTDEQSWDLLEQKVYNEGKCPSELCQTGKEIAKKCKGLPLALVVVGGVLVNGTQTRGFWKQVKNSLSSYLARDSHSQFMAALELSYTYLPDCLKPMFLYFGTFPEDNEIPAKKLMQLWMAEGFVQKTESSSLESQAEKNLIDLIDRSLVMVAERRWDGRVKACHVHDLLRDMCLAKAKEEKFMQQVNVHIEVPDPIMYQRRLSIFLERNDETTSQHLLNLSKFSITPPIYSLLFFHVGSGYLTGEGLQGIEPVISSLKLLKVLDAQMFEINQDALDEDLTMLVHLRYLSFKTTSWSIPLAISRLQRLETLIIKKRNSDYINVPETIWEMRKLRHLHINNGYGKFSVASENSFALENLQTLSGFYTDNGEEKKIFRKLPALKRLRCQYKYTKQFQFPDFESLGKLESLTFSLRGAPQKLRSQLKFPLTLKKLNIYGLNLEWSQISMLKTLPNLEVLKLDSSVVDEVWDMGDDDVFTNLKFLKLEDLEINRWSASSVNFPSLETLVFVWCTELVEISSELGEIDTLKKIEVKWCSISVEKQVKEIQKEQEEFDNNSLKFYFYRNVEED